MAGGATCGLAVAAATGCSCHSPSLQPWITRLPGVVVEGTWSLAPAVGGDRSHVGGASSCRLFVVKCASPVNRYRAKKRATIRSPSYHLRCRGRLPRNVVNEGVRGAGRGATPRPTGHGRGAAAGRRCGEGRHGPVILHAGISGCKMPPTERRRVRVGSQARLRRAPGPFPRSPPHAVVRRETSRRASARRPETGR